MVAIVGAPEKAGYQGHVGCAYNPTGPSVRRFGWLPCENADRVVQMSGGTRRPDRREGKPTCTQ